MTTEQAAELIEAVQISNHALIQIIKHLDILIGMVGETTAPGFLEYWNNAKTEPDESYDEWLKRKEGNA